MYGTKAQTGTLPTPAANSALAARRRQQLRPFFFHMGPVALCITSVLLIAFMAVLYLNELGQSDSANQQLQHIRAQQDTLTRENQDLVFTIAQEQSPAYIAHAAQLQGMILADPASIKIIVVHHMQPIPTTNPEIQP